VKILARDDRSIRIAVPKGEVSLALELIEASTVLRSRGLPPSRRSSLVNAGEDNIQQPRLPLSPPAYVHRWRMDGFLIVLFVAMMGWIAALVWVQHDVKGDSRDGPSRKRHCAFTPFCWVLDVSGQASASFPCSESPRTLTGRVAG